METLATPISDGNCKSDKAEIGKCIFELLAPLSYVIWIFSISPTTPKSVSFSIAFITIFNFSISTNGWSLLDIPL